jgi:glycosyltransferase involved in cell wall biosynthesis
MKILILSNSNSEHTQKWALGLAQKGFEIGIFSFKKCETDIYKYRDNIKILYEPKEQKGHLSILDKFNYFSLLGKLKKAIRDFQPDVLHAHYVSSYGLLGALSGFKNFVVSAWGSDILDFPQKNFVFENIVQFVLKKAKRITVSSDVLQREIALYTSKKTLVIPFGIDTGIFKGEKDPHKELVFCSTKHLEKMYNIEIIIRAFKLLSDIHGNVKLKIAGDGTQSANLKALCAYLNMQRNVEFVGRIPNGEMPQLLNSSDVLINIPGNESFGVSVIEAMACKKGLIVSNIPAFETLISDKKNGFKIDPVKIETLYLAMEKYVLNKDLVKQHGELNRKKVEAEFDLRTNLHQMSLVYLELDNLHALPDSLTPVAQILKKSA